MAVYPLFLFTDFLLTCTAKKDEFQRLDRNEKIAKNPAIKPFLA
jgi:hypothetical protein